MDEKKRSQKLAEKLAHQKENKKYTKLYREVAKGVVETAHGYILDFSDELVLMQETDDFEMKGFCLFPRRQIAKLRCNEFDRYYQKIMEWEHQTEQIGTSHNVNLKSLNLAFKSIQTCGLNVIVECEDPEIDSFTIGPIVKIGKKYIHIRNFDPTGKLDADPTPIDYASISKVMFDDRYINVFSKYLRES